MKKKFVKSTLQERIDWLRFNIVEATNTHGVPCGCILCESLIFDTLAKEGKVNLKTGERKS